MNKLPPLSVLVTRPDPQGFDLCAVLEKHQFKTHYLPTITFAPVEQNNMQAILASLNEQDWLIFTSPRAVWTSVPYIRQAWPDLPATVHFAAVGKGTAEALKEAGYLAIYPEQGEGADCLLALPEFKRVAGLAVTIVKGVNGREILQDVLTNREARVTMWATYRRMLPVLDMQPTLDLLSAGFLDVIVCTSCDGMRHLETLIGEKQVASLHALPLIVVSERIKTLAKDLGYQTIWVADQASHHAILDVLEQKKEVLCKIQQTKYAHRTNQ